VVATDPLVRTVERGDTRAMRSRTFGPLDNPVVLLGQGTWNMERDDRSAAIAALRAGIDAGMTHIDTAELYGAGQVEMLVREAIDGRRDELFLVSKVLPSNASRRGTMTACERSLARLGIERLDLYLLHWPGSYPLGETIEAFEELQAAGKIGAWGVSNFAVDEMEEALAISGPGRIACNQVLYHLQERSIEHGVVPWCAAHDVAVVAYSPFGSGSFPSSRSAAGAVLASIARARDATPYQIALAFLTREAHVFAIPKAARPDHVTQNAAACEIVLDAAEIAALDRAFPRGPKRRGVATI